MSLAGLTLPSLSEADPPIGGEGTLDPLGLATFADRLAEHLVPGVRTRMRRIRFVTASAVGALAGEALHDVPPADGISPPSVCFEWMLLEAYARRNNDERALDEFGIPGSAKARAVVAIDGRRLTARNYLKQPMVFGFTGVFMPLSRGFHVLDEDRRPDERLAELTDAWERDQDLVGFTDEVPGTPGRNFRRRLATDLESTLRTGRCAIEPGSQLLGQLARTLHPTKAGERERGLLRTWLLAESEAVRAELATAVAGLERGTDKFLAEQVRASEPSMDVQLRLDAILGFERVASMMTSAFGQLRYSSSLLGTKPLFVDSLGDDPILQWVAGDLPVAFERASALLDRLDPAVNTQFIDRLGQFGARLTPSELGHALLLHHCATQARKLPHGKRPWFDEYGDGWVVRRQYRTADESHVGTDYFVHPYRLTALQGFMEDIRP